ncbi:hypothetical protein ABWL24_19435 [Priestia megaterium]
MNINSIGSVTPVKKTASPAVEPSPPPLRLTDSLQQLAVPFYV